jgi:hypothetical protein
LRATPLGALSRGEHRPTLRADRGVDVAQLLECDREARLRELVARRCGTELRGVFEVGEGGWRVAREACTATREEEASEPCAILVVPARADGTAEVFDRLELLERFTRAALLVGELCEGESRGDVPRIREHLALQRATRFDGTTRTNELRHVDRCGRTHATRRSGE